MARCKLPCCTTPARPRKRPADYEPDFDGPGDWRDHYERIVYGRFDRPAGLPVQADATDLGANETLSRLSKNEGE